MIRIVNQLNWLNFLPEFCIKIKVRCISTSEACALDISNCALNSERAKISHALLFWRLRISLGDKIVGEFYYKNTSATLCQTLKGIGTETFVLSIMVKFLGSRSMKNFVSAGSKYSIHAGNASQLMHLSLQEHTVYKCIVVQSTLITF